MIASHHLSNAAVAVLVAVALVVIPRLRRDPRWRELAAQLWQRRRWAVLLFVTTKLSLLTEWQRVISSVPPSCTYGIVRNHPTTAIEESIAASWRVISPQAKAGPVGPAFDMNRKITSDPLRMLLLPLPALLSTRRLLFRAEPSCRLRPS